MGDRRFFDWFFYRGVLRKFLYKRILSFTGRRVKAKLAYVLGFDRTSVLVIGNVYYN